MKREFPVALAGIFHLLRANTMAPRDENKNPTGSVAEKLAGQDVVDGVDLQDCKTSQVRVRSTGHIRHA